MINKITDLIFTDTGKDTAIVAIGTLINILAGGLFFVLVPRLLGPAKYGLFATTVTTSIFAVNLANLGIDTGILRFAQNNKIQSNAILSLAFKSYVVVGIAVGLCGILFSQLLANFLNQPDLSLLFKIAFLSTILLLLTNFYTAALQAQKKFIQSSLITAFSNLARLIVLLVGALLLTVSINFVTLLFFLVNIVSIIAGRMFLSFKFEKVDSNVLREFFGFNSWVWISLLITSIPYDNFLLLKLSGSVQTGLYFAPFKILSVAYQLGGNFSRVVASRFTSFETNQKVREFAKKTLPIIGVFVLAMLGLIPFARTITRIFFGESYANSANIFRFLALGFSLFFASIIPSAIILYYLGKSKTAFYITSFKVVIFLAFLLFLIPRYAGIGAAAAYMFSEFAFFVVATAFVLYKLQSK